MYLTTLMLRLSLLCMQVLDLQGMSCESLRMLEISWPGQLSLPVQALIKAPCLEVVHICNVNFSQWGTIDEMHVLPEDLPGSSVNPLNLNEAIDARKVLSSAGFEFGTRANGLVRVTRILRNKHLNFSTEQTFAVAPPRSD